MLSVLIGTSYSLPPLRLKVGGLERSRACVAVLSIGVTVPFSWYFFLGGGGELLVFDDSGARSWFSW